MESYFNNAFLQILKSTFPNLDNKVHQFKFYLQKSTVA